MNELISNRFAVFVTCTHILTYLWNRLLIDFYLCVYDRVCKVPRVLFNICVCKWKLIFLGRILSFIFYWFGMVRRKLTIPERPLPRPTGYELVLSRRRFARSTCTWTVSNIPRLTKTLHQSYNDGMVNPEVVCHPSMAKTTVMHANSWCTSW